MATVKRLRDGTLFVDCPTERVSDSFRAAKRLGDYDVTVSLHKSLNSCKGVVRCSQWRDINEEELKEGLASQGVTL